MAGLTHGTEVRPDQLPQVVDGVEFEPVPLAEVAETDPFGDGKRITVDRPVNVTQLMDEISEATGVQVSISLIWPEGAEKGTLFVSPGSAVDGRTVAGKIRTHEPDDLYGLSETDRALAEVMNKVRSKRPLTDSERDLALLALSQRGR
jgi:hypothetical protein